MNGKERVLKMIEEGKVTAAEGVELLKALSEGQVNVQRTEEEQVKTEEEKVTEERKKKRISQLKVRILIEKENIDLNVNIPISIVKIMSSVAEDFDGFIPEEAKKAMKDQGIHLDIMEIIKAIESIEQGFLENLNIVDIDAKEADGRAVVIKVYVD